MNNKKMWVCSLLSSALIFSPFGYISGMDSTDSTNSTIYDSLRELGDLDGDLLCTILGQLVSITACAIKFVAGEETNGYSLQTHFTTFKGSEKARKIANDIYNFLSNEFKYQDKCRNIQLWYRGLIFRASYTNENNPPILEYIKGLSNDEEKIFNCLRSYCRWKRECLKEQQAIANSKIEEANTVVGDDDNPINLSELNPQTLELGIQTQNMINSAMEGILKVLAKHISTRGDNKGWINNLINNQNYKFKVFE